MLDCKVWTRVPGKMHKRLDTTTTSCVLLRCSLYGKVRVMLPADQALEKTGPCLVREEFFLMKQVQNAVTVCSREIGDSRLNDCDEATFD